MRIIQQRFSPRRIEQSEKLIIEAKNFIPRHIKYAVASTSFAARQRKFFFFRAHPDGRIKVTGGRARPPTPPFSPSIAEGIERKDEGRQIEKSWRDRSESAPDCTRDRAYRAAVASSRHDAVPSLQNTCAIPAAGIFPLRILGRETGGGDGTRGRYRSVSLSRVYAPDARTCYAPRRRRRRRGRHGASTGPAASCSRMHAGGGDSREGNARPSVFIPRGRSRTARRDRWRFRSAPESPLCGRRREDSVRKGRGGRGSSER